MVFDWLREGSYSPAATLTKTLLPKIWAGYCWLSGMFILACIFALGLLEYGGSVKPAVVIDGPAQSDDFEWREGRTKLPTMRVPLGHKFSFRLPWHVQEGGCERIITRTFIRGAQGYDAYVLTQQMVGKPYPVGRPGMDHIERELPRGIEPGLWLYRAVGTVQNCPLPRKPEPTLYAEFYIDVYDPDGPVSIEVGSPKVITPKIKMGGKLQYRESFKRTEQINSEVLFTFTEINGDDIVIERRPVAYTRAGDFKDIDVTTPLPQGVHLGKWRMQKTVLSTRPGGRTRVDPMFQIEFEVVP
jgi:hypothetical protein